MEKYGNNTIIVGHYFVQNGDLMGDPMLAMEDISGYWSPLYVEQADMLRKKLAGTLNMKKGRHPNMDYLEK